MFTQTLQRNNFRYERKFTLTPYIYEVLRRRCAAVMKKDEYSVGKDYRITSLYFDDVFRRAYHDKLVGIKSRKKFRIRVYNLNPERITLECKHKEGNFVTKRSSLLTQEQYEKLLKGDYGFCGEALENTALREFYVHARTAGLKPAVIVDYYREAFSGDKTKLGNVRITFDREISAGFNSTDMFKAHYSPVFQNNIVLEVKYNKFLPAYIQELFTGFELIEEPISKYVMCVEKFLEVNKR